MKPLLLFASIGLLVSLGCTGNVGNPGERIGEPEPDPFFPPGSIDPSEQSAATAIPRLSRREMEASVADVFGITGVVERLVPPDADVAVSPRTNGDEDIYDTFAGTLGEYLPGEVFVQAIANMAFEVARDVAADSSSVDGLAGCTPTDASDTGCMSAFIANTGRRLFRRPLTDDEQARLDRMAGEFTSEGDFYLGARVVIQSLLQSPEFIYRPEVGDQVAPGVRKLNNFELASRLAFTFWGAAPSESLLDMASGPELTDDEFQTLVMMVASDPRTESQMRNMHTMWLRYEGAIVSDLDLRADFLAESNALVDRVLTDSTRPWSDLFTSTESFVTPRLATHYGMSDVSEAGWASYEHPERAGLLSHGSFLSLSSTQATGTLPSRRGAMILGRILCSPPPPPPPDVDVDDGVEVSEGDCKSDAYDAHRAAGSGCAGCHSLMDPVGFGFERFDGQGRFREVERENPSCTIEGQGTAAGQEFSGPREFVAAVVTSGDLTQCATEQLMAFALRRRPAREDDPARDRLHEAFVDSGEDFRSLLVEFALDPTFRFRVEASP